MIASLKTLWWHESFPSTHFIVTNKTNCSGVKIILDIANLFAITKCYESGSWCEKHLQQRHLQKHKLYYRSS